MNGLSFLLTYIGIVVVALGGLGFILWIYLSITGYFKEVLTTLQWIHQLLEEEYQGDDESEEEEGEE